MARRYGMNIPLWVKVFQALWFWYLVSFVGGAALSLWFSRIHLDGWPHALATGGYLVLIILVMFGARLLVRWRLKKHPLYYLVAMREELGKKN